MRQPGSSVVAAACDRREGENVTARCRVHSKWHSGFSMIRHDQSRNTDLC